MTEEIWRTCLRQASATCRGSGQIWIADELDALQREIDLLEVSRDSVAVVRKARERIEELEQTIETIEHEVALVYDHVTMGVFSKANTIAQFVIDRADEVAKEYYGNGWVKK